MQKNTGDIPEIFVIQSFEKVGGNGSDLILWEAFRQPSGMYFYNKINRNHVQGQVEG